MALIIAVIGCLIAAVIDFRLRRIPNVLTYAMMAAGLAIATLDGNWHLQTLGFGLAVLIIVPLVWLAGMGMGDAKLLVALEILLGPVAFLEIVIAAILCGAVVGLVVWATSAVRQGFRQRRSIHQTAEGGSKVAVVTFRELHLPFAVPIAIAVILLETPAGSLVGY
jgi:Flp pilus assembly protein protease CpaA